MEERNIELTSEHISILLYLINKDTYLSEQKEIVSYLKKMLVQILNKTCQTKARKEL